MIQAICFGKVFFWSRQSSNVANIFSTAIQFVDVVKIPTPFIAYSFDVFSDTN